MTSPRLTPAVAREARPGDTLSDHEVRGLQLRCTRTKKAWYLYYRTRAGAERRPKLGDFPEMSLTAARSAAQAIKGEVATGRDPSADWQAQRDAPSVADLCRMYLEDWAPVHKAASSLRQDRLLIERHVLPGLGRAKVADLETHDIERFLEDVRRRRYVPKAYLARYGADDAPGARNRVRALLSKLFTLASTRYKMRPDHPVKGTAKAREPGRRRVMTPAELQAVTLALRGALDATPKQATALLAQLLTGARVGEIQRATRRQWQGASLVLDEHKTANAIGTKTIPLPPLVVALLEHLDRTERYGADEPLFGGVDVRWVWDRLRVDAGCPDLQMRDFRKAFASYALGSGKSLAQIGDIYGHTDPRTTAGYAWLLQDVRQQLVTDVAGTMLAIAEAPLIDKSKGE